MDGIHDLGGMHGFGRVERAADEPVFHAVWEARIFALTLAVPYSVRFSDDHFRRTMEWMPPADYLSATYYERWLATLTALLQESGVVTRSELEGGPLQALPDGVLPPLPADNVSAAIAAGASQAVPDAPDAAHRFKAGDRIRTRRHGSAGHTRLPRYARGRLGTIAAERGSFVLADANAAGLGRVPEQLYSVEFTARELWGDEASPTDTVRLDLWDSYLEPVS